ncbi:G1 family glutamic endopeptidase [Streptomyces sp. NPDC001250]|uniref:G1 family glutamic endopeptidase n=1 Tax=unclassified Streptomyces TaxID=2593676 RepID=UPI00333083F4
MPQRASACLLTVATTIAVTALTAPAARAAAPTTHSVLEARINGTAASRQTHDLQGLSDATKTNATSGNWSGYVASGSSGTYKSVASSWIQPAVKCDSHDSYSSYWVGLDGYRNKALEQTGTEADCIGGKAHYGAWWEVIPAAESPYSVTVAPGDHLTASVKDNGDGTFTMMLSDSTQGWTRATTHAGSAGYQDSSAEVIAEATTANGSIASLPDFGSVDFSDSQANGTTFGSLSPTPLTMQNHDSGDVMAKPGAISGGDFAVTWESPN